MPLRSERSRAFVGVGPNIGPICGWVGCLLHRRLCAKVRLATVKLPNSGGCLRFCAELPANDDVDAVGKLSLT